MRRNQGWVFWAFFLAFRYQDATYFRSIPGSPNTYTGSSVRLRTMMLHQVMHAQDGHLWCYPLADTYRAAWCSKNWGEMALIAYP